MKVALLTVSLFTLCACTLIQYKSDLGLTMSSAEANSPEYLIKLNGTICRDVDNNIGFCAKRISSVSDLKIEILPQQYAYTFKLDCTDSVNSDTSFDVLPNTSAINVISFKSFTGIKLFNCAVDIIPLDRTQPIAAFARFQAIVVDGNYQSAESISYQRGHMVFGSSAHYVKYFDGKNWVDSKNLTAKQMKDTPAMTETESMRYAYHGI